MLDETRVLEIAGGTAGPIAGMLLADAGADVVKVEPPGGDPERVEPGAAMWDRGKRSVTADLAAAAGRRRVAALLAGADVLIVNGPPSRLAARGLEPAAVRAAHPHLVLLHVPPWPDGEPWAGGRESHALLAATGGVALRQASWGGGPIELVYPHILYAQGIWAAACAVAALLERDRSGAGQAVTVSGAHAGLVTSSSAVVWEPGRPFRNAAVGPGGANPSYSRYRCGDGRWLFLGALTPKFQDRAFAVLGQAGLLDDPRVGGARPRLMAPENRDWVRARLAEAFASRPREAWLAALAAADCPAGPLEDRAGWLDHPQVRAIGMRVELDDPARGRVVMAGNPLVLERTPNRVRGPAPRLGQHDGEPIAWPARAAPRGPEPSGGGPLAGCRVLDLGTIVAGPFAGVLLADLGADVVKVEPPDGDSFREPGFAYNRGMRSLAVDLRDRAGHRAFAELVRRADVVIDNYRPGVLERLGIDRGSLAQVNPDVITASITGYGEGGPLSADPGFDPILQARSGMMTAQGGDDEPVLHNIPVNDVAAAAFTALGVCFALAHRRRGRGGQRVTASLAGMAAFMQGGELLRREGRPPAPDGGRDHAGRGPLDRYYPVRDGWVRVQAGAADLPALRGAGLLPPGPDGLAEADPALALALAGLTRAEAVGRLRAAAVPAAAARRFEELPDDPNVVAAEVVHAVDRDDGTRYFAPGRYARFSRTERRDVLLPPGLGEHSRAVLAEAGLGSDEIEALIRAGAVVEGPPLVARLHDYR